MKLLSRDPSKSKARLNIICCNNLGDLSLPFHLSSDDRIGAKTSSGGQLGTTTMDQLKSKVAIVTGAASGIGAACPRHWRERPRRSWRPIATIHPGRKNQVGGRRSDLPVARRDRRDAVERSRYRRGSTVWQARHSGLERRHRRSPGCAARRAWPSFGRPRAECACLPKLSRSNTHASAYG